MNATARQHHWMAFLKFFSEHNQNRLTRLGVFEGEPEAMTDYWIEAGLPFAEITVEAGGDLPTIEILLGDQTRHYTHTIKGVRHISLHFSPAGEEEGLDVRDAEGKTTVLRFEN